MASPSEARIALGPKKGEDSLSLIGFFEADSNRNISAARFWQYRDTSLHALRSLKTDLDF